MSKTDQRIKEIREQQIGNSAKRALIVEGKDDVDVFASFLNKAHPGWENSWVISQADNKTNALNIIKEETGWLGVVDPDEWPDTKIIQLETEYNNLWVLPRYCVESYLIMPEEIWAALPSHQREKINGGLDGLTQQIKVDLNLWRCHSALWSVINPLWKSLRSLGFNDDLLKPEIATNDQLIRQKLSEWYAHLEPEQIWQQYQQTLQHIAQLAEEEQLKRWFHGKQFFKGVICPLLNQQLGQKKSEDHMRDILRTLPVPQDLSPLWHKMGLTA